MHLLDLNHILYIIHILILQHHVGDAYPTQHASPTPEEIFYT